MPLLGDAGFRYSHHSQMLPPPIQFPPFVLLRVLLMLCFRERKSLHSSRRPYFSLQIPNTSPLHTGPSQRPSFLDSAPLSLSLSLFFVSKDDSPGTVWELVIIPVLLIVLFSPNPKDGPFFSPSLAERDGTGPTLGQEEFFCRSRLA